MVAKNWFTLLNKQIIMTNEIAAINHLPKVELLHQNVLVKTNEGLTRHLKLAIFYGDKLLYCDTMILPFRQSTSYFYESFLNRIITHGILTHYLATK